MTMHSMQLTTLFMDKAEKEPGYAIAYAIMQLAAEQERLVHAVQDLGNGNAATPMGALEAFGKLMGEKMDDLTSAISELADNDV